MISVAEKEVILPGWRRSLQRYAFPSFVRTPYLYLRDKAKVHPTAKVQIGSNIKFGKGTVVKAYAVVQSSGGRIEVGSDCAIGCFSHLMAGVADIIIGNDVRLGSRVTIIATTREYRSRTQKIVDQGFRDRGIRIGNDVLVGSGVTLVDGCKIGDGAVIGVGSVVTGKVPPYAVVFGSPAKVVFYRE